MKIILTLALALITSTTFARDITVSGIKAKALYDVLAIEKLHEFNDAAMGKQYVTIGSIDCVKKVLADSQMAACTFNSPIGSDPAEVKLTSEEDFNELNQIRFVLAEVTGAEITTNAETKTLKVKSLSCKYYGYGSVLDSLEIEVRYNCTISL
jgi:hypothetical protein